MVIARRPAAQIAKPKRYFMRDQVAIDYTTPISMKKHKKCGGEPKVTNAKGTVIQCMRCHKEMFLLENALSKNVATWNTHYYTERITEVFPDKLEPVYKSVEKTDGARAFSSWELLKPKALIRYHYGKDPEVVDA